LADLLLHDGALQSPVLSSGGVCQILNFEFIDRCQTRVYVYERNETGVSTERHPSY